MTRLNIPLFVALAASLLSAVPANGSRDMLPHQRMIRRRGPGPVGDIVAYDHGIHVRQVVPIPTASGSTSGTGSAAAPTSSTSSTSVAPAVTTTSQATTSTSSVATTSSAPTSTAASTTSSGLLDSLTNLLGTTSTSSVVTSTTPSTSAAPTTSSAAPASVVPQTSDTPAAATTTPTINIANTTPSPTREVGTTITVASTVLPEVQASQSAAAKKAKITRNTIISLVVIASCIGGAIAIWTVIRKWKLSPSEKFDDRMQPIDWAPQGAGAHDETMEEKKHRRAGSSGSHGSFTSGGVGQSETGHAKGMYNDSQHGHAYGAQAQDFPPPHDFTAGATTGPAYGQYYGNQQYAGGSGYADLQRGASVSESTYSHGATVTRGMSYSRGPAQGYEAQPGAGGVPPLPNPYGGEANPYGGEYGYEDYGHQAGQHPQAQVLAQAQPQVQAPYRGYN